LGFGGINGNSGGISPKVGGINRKVGGIQSQVGGINGKVGGIFPLSGQNKFASWWINTITGVK
jgi:hypothetical protein